MPARKIITSHLYPPIPDRTHDWCAYYDGEEEAGHYGYGRTEQEAIDDLRRLREEMDEGAEAAAHAPPPLPPHYHGFNTAFGGLIDIFAAAGGWDEEKR